MTPCREGIRRVVRLRLPPCWLPSVQDIFNGSGDIFGRCAALLNVVLGGGEGPSSISISESEPLVRSMIKSSMLSWAALSASRCASSPDAHALSSRARRSAAYHDRSISIDEDMKAEALTSAASSPNDLAGVEVAPPSRRLPLMSCPSFLRFSAASRALDRATWGGRSCETPCPTRRPLEWNPSPL